MVMIYALATDGTIFATRHRASEVIDSIRALHSWDSEVLTIDLGGVQVISPSFAMAFIQGLHELAEQDDSAPRAVHINSGSSTVRSQLDSTLRRFREFADTRTAEVVIA